MGYRPIVAESNLANMFKNNGVYQANFGFIEDYLKIPQLYSYIEEAIPRRKNHVPNCL